MDGGAAFVQGLALSLATIMALGPQNLHVLRTGLARHHVGTTVAFCIAADALFVGSALAGVAGALARLKGLATPLALVAALALAWFAWRALADARRPPVLAGDIRAGYAARPALRRTLAATAVVTFGNPSVWIETLLLVGATGAALPAAQRLAFGGGALAGSLLWFTTLGYGARLASPWLTRPAGWRVTSWVSALSLAAMSLCWASEALT